MAISGFLDPLQFYPLPGFGLTEHGVSTLICRRGTLGVNVVTGGLDDDDTPDPEHIQRLKEPGTGNNLDLW